MYFSQHTGTPGLGGSLFTSLLAHGIGLSLVLRNAGVNLPVKRISAVRLTSKLFLIPFRRLTGQYPDGLATRKR
jgi:hypothetical protein